MTFLHRQTTTRSTENTLSLKKRLPDLPHPVAVENIPQNQDGKQNRLLKRVGSIFSLRKRPNLDLQLVYGTYHSQNTRTTTNRRSYGDDDDDDDNDNDNDDDSLRSSPESENEIRCPSGLGSAVSIISKRSLPPSPFYPPNGSPYDPVCTHSHFLKRAISSPNLLRSFSLRVRGRNRGRRASEVAVKALPPPPAPTRRNTTLPEIIIFLILTHLPQEHTPSCATVSRLFASAARSVLYTHIDTSSITDTKLERLITLLSSQSHLAELVTSFTCPEWPAFFVSANEQGGIRQRRLGDARLTAIFTLALERMYNLTSLTLPSFDSSFVAHHTSFGLKSITFLNSTMSDAETKALFAWLDGQVNVSTLRFPNLFDIETSSGSIKTKTRTDTSRPQTSHSSYLTPSKHTFSPSSYPNTPSPSPTPSLLTQNTTTLFSSPTLLPNLSILHATPSLVISLSSPFIETSRPLTSVFLNINSTLYSGLRPASLMSAISGISHLGLCFGPSVDRRSFEKVIGAAGASLGSSSSTEEEEDPFVVVEKNGSQSTTRSGLREFEISFQTPGVPGRDEVVYKSVQASLPRYCALSTLKFLVQNATVCDFESSRPAAEQDMIESWVKTCPSLTSISLFSGTIWTQSHGIHRAGEFT